MALIHDMVEFGHVIACQLTVTCNVLKIQIRVSELIV